MEKEKIRSYARELGADVVGFASIDDYRCAATVDPRTILDAVKSLVVLGYREIDGAVETGNDRLCMASRIGILHVSSRTNYLLCRYIEDELGVKAVPVPVREPLPMNTPAMGTVADVSLRHAAIAAGLGVFGRHNLVIHPRFGTRIIFAAILTQLPLASDPPVKDDLCDDCGLCVESCPGHALDEKGKTHVWHCLKASQPYGIGAAARYIDRLLNASPDERKTLLRDPFFVALYQALFIGFQYTCNRCVAVCPACIGV